VGLKNLAIGFIAGVSVVACSGMPKFPYKHYSLSAVSYDGSLLGPTAPQDRNLKECEPTQTDKAPCQVLFTRDLLKLKADYLETKARLISCEEGQ
jgi:hypothetical protein